MTLRLDSPVNQIKGVGDKYRQIFNKNTITTVFELLFHFPALYIDFSRPAVNIETGIKNLYRLEVINCNLARHFGRRFSILKVNARAGTEKVQVVFFNKPYLADYFKENPQVFIYGTFEMREQIYQVNTPLVFSLSDPEAEPVIPLYNKIGVMKSGVLKKIIKNCLQELQDTYELLPQQIIKCYNFPGIVDAFKAIHFPAQYDPGQIQELKQRFIYSEFLLFQLELQYIRNFFKKVPRLHRYQIDENLKAFIKDLLPFDLTPDQKTACRELAADLSKDVTMQRLLQGDVGAGKTAVAFIALLMAATSGFQGAFLAPTEILAQQHFLNGQKFFIPSTVNSKNNRTPITIEILTGSTPAKERARIRQQLLDGTIHIIFGTHALLNETIRFKNLSMVIIDEQHRFGVSQRAALYYKGKAVDLLVTTATPIPRTMLLSLYNDLSVSIIKTKPRGRLPILTKIMDEARRDEFYHWLHTKIQAGEGEKAYIILPLIEDSEFFTELRSIESEAEYFKNMFKGIPLGIISGRATPDEKEAAIADFTTGKTRVLVSTTVIEVGIDVKDATVMVIENADRYGLSQLHQLRGRVGRGERQSYCYLFSSPNITESGQQRLQTIASTTDGFKIAETDLQMRGGGIISGFEQSGYLDFKVGNMQDDHEIFDDSRNDAALILADPALQNNYISNFLTEIKRKLQDINFS
ncbi:MAG TPA: ATP-dependent DNA helicase RecG [Candidatus Deferrimicrobium sp.]|nr:ATP-dependent DNA helicase RecG [Candidatus Deferrimicrobium sp.]